MTGRNPTRECREVVTGPAKHELNRTPEGLDGRGRTPARLDPPVGPAGAHTSVLPGGSCEAVRHREERNAP